MMITEFRLLMYQGRNPLTLSVRQSILIDKGRAPPYWYGLKIEVGSLFHHFEYLWVLCYYYNYILVGFSFNIVYVTFTKLATVEDLAVLTA